MRQALRFLGNLSKGLRELREQYSFGMIQEIMNACWSESGSLNLSQLEPQVALLKIVPWMYLLSKLLRLPGIGEMFDKVWS